MNYMISRLDHYYNLQLNCATLYRYIEDPQGMTCPHHHNDYEIYLLKSGNRKYFIQNTIYTLQPNQIVIFKPNVPHQVTVNLNIPYERHIIYITPQLFSEIIAHNPPLKRILDIQLFNLSQEDFSLALSYISKINEELERNDIYSQSIIRNILADFLMFISRNNDTSKLIINKGDLRIQSAIDYILEHYSEHITLSDCAKIACMHYNTFSTVFRNTTAIGFKDFLTRTRIEKSCELLENTNYSITRISELVGFLTSTHFSSSFKALKKMSPKEYRIQSKRKIHNSSIKSDPAQTGNFSFIAKTSKPQTN